MGSIEVLDVSLEFKVNVLRSRSLKDALLTRLKSGAPVSERFKALQDVSLSVRKGEAVALIGHNGSGKSTLLRVLAGIYHPQRGSVSVTGRIAPLIELSAGFDAELSGLENIHLACSLMGLSSGEIVERTASIVEFAELEDQINIPFKNFSSGMQARLAFACATAVDPDVLLADEVLSVGDVNFTRKCLARVADMRRRGTTLVLVSHDEAAVRKFCARSILLESGRVLFDGPTSKALALYKQLMEERFSKRAESLADSKGAASQLQREMLQEESVRLLQEGAIQIPKVRFECDFAQEGSEPGRAIPVVDFARPFEIVINIAVAEASRFRPPVTIGFALHTADDVRIGGGNTGMFRLEIPTADLGDAPGTITCRFPFPAGLPFFAAGSFFLVCAVHDFGLMRQISVQRVVDFEGVNSLFGEAEFTDIAYLPKYFDQPRIEVRRQ